MNAADKIQQPDNYADYQHWWNQHGKQRIADYVSGKTSYVADLSPQRALDFTGVELLQLLHRRLGNDLLQRALDPVHSIPTRGPALNLRKTNTVGINVRTIGSFWRLLKYTLTLPASVQGVHLLPIWEPGVVGSLYGMASWNLNPAFFDAEPARQFPALRTVEAQLKVVINLLHAQGKVVGMDVIPHTDRYAEMVLANPCFFEWLRRDGLSIVDHREHLHWDAERAILEWLGTVGAVERPRGETGQLVDHLSRGVLTDDKQLAFFGQLDSATRTRVLFGQPADYDGRRERRIALVDWLYRRGLEPVPATMAPPYRGLVVDPRPEAATIDDAGRTWRDYRITAPEEMSRVFGPLARYKFYGRRDDNREWAIDFDRPRPTVWDYFTDGYAKVAEEYGFDFMRGDMSHVQMRPGGVPPAEEIDEYYDPLRAVKLRVRREVNPDFAYFAESFLAPPGYMAYGDEVEHLLASEAEVTLGNLQSMVPGEAEFMEELGHYLKIEQATELTPAFTAITGDKDDPRFDRFHHHGELVRLFTGFFLGRLPLYYSLGFEQRDRKYEPWPNEYYTKLYVFQEREGPKSVSGPWRWGGNFALFWGLQRLFRFAEGVMGHLVEASTVIQSGGAAGNLSWVREASDGDGGYLFIAHFGATEQERIVLHNLKDYEQADLVFSTAEHPHELLTVVAGNCMVPLLQGGEGRCYRLT